MRTDLFDYELPPELIARYPSEARDGGRVLVLGNEGVEHREMATWPELVPAGALVVVNATRVRHARLWCRRRGSLGRVELLLLEPLFAAGRGRWRALGRANSPLRAGQEVEAPGAAVFTIERVLGEGILEVSANVEGGLEEYLAEHGRVPIPPYLERADEAVDRERYQTIFARSLGSVAAPTAGLHLTRAALDRLGARGVELGELVLHVGLATFRPVSTETLDQHSMHAERWMVSERLAADVSRARARGAPVVAVGTTVVRALESAADEDRPGHVRAEEGETRLFIRPGYRFRVVDSLLTNFHQPRSTLLALVAAFAGRERVLAAYGEALRVGYRFLSYGDAMWIPRRLPW